MLAGRTSFLIEDFHTPLTQDMTGAYAQPWRVRKTRDAYHFYADYKPGLSKGYVPNGRNANCFFKAPAGCWTRTTIVLKIDRSGS